MPFTRLLEGYTPPVGTAWYGYRVDEASFPSEDVSVTIDAVRPLSPPVTDPDDPPTYTFATNNATLETGWYRIVWTDGAGGAVATAWAEYRPVPAYAPTVADVASILRARAVEPGGYRVVNFTDQTSPTAQSVQNLIAIFAPIIFARAGRLDDLHCSNAADLRSAVRGIAAQRVALEVEASYWPEEVVDQASVESRRQSLDSDLEGVMGALVACRASDDDGGNGPESDSPSDPAWRYPAPTPLRW